MKARLLNFLAKLRTSMWLIPATLVLFAVGVAVFVSAFQVRVEPPEVLRGLLFAGDASSARAILAAIAGSMIGVTGVTFSITIVALVLASTQFGPRLLRNFMRDRANQAVLGTFIATFTFCLLGLRSVRDDAGPRGGAYLTVIVGILLALVSLGVFIFFIHHIASSIQADCIIANVALELGETIERMYPESVGVAADDASLELPARFVEGSAPVPARRSGYLQAVEGETLMAIATQHDLILRLDVRPGGYVIAGAPILRAFPSERVNAEVVEALAATMITGIRRTAEQDIEFLVDQLSEVALRSLSPGINDPFTAITCIDRLGDAIFRLSHRHMPSSIRKDEAGVARVFATAPTFGGLVDSAFDQVRQYGKGSVAVTIRLLETFERLVDVNARDAARLRVIRAHADRVLASSGLVEHEAHDRREIVDRHARAVRAVLT